MIPLSYAQHRLWFLNRLEGPSAAYNAPVVLRLDGVPDREALEAAVRDVVDRHEVLRTVYGAVDGEPYQDIVGDPDVRLEVRECGPGDDVDALVTAFVRLPFDVTRDLPLRARLFTVHDTSAVLVLLVHHIATDGWSVGCLLNDLDRAYTARCGGRAPGWEPLPVQYADYALWQRDMLGDPADPESPAYEQLAHWREALDGAPAATRLPADRPRPAEPSHRGALVTARLSAAAHKALAHTARAHRATFFMTARAALCAALQAAGAGPDVVVGTPVASCGPRRICTTSSASSSTRSPCAPICPTTRTSARCSTGSANGTWPPWPTRTCRSTCSSRTSTPNGPSACTPSSRSC